jgi:hypothetical protein
MSQRNRTQSPADALADEFRQEMASALGRLGRALEGSLAALARFDAEHSQTMSAAECRQLRASLVAEASRALWHFVVQREAAACATCATFCAITACRARSPRAWVRCRASRSRRKATRSARARRGAAARRCAIDAGTPRL